MTPAAIAGLIAVALAMGIALGTIGAGGSILAIPALVYLAGLDAHDATVVSLIVVAASAAAGMLGHLREQNVAWRIMPVIIGGILIGTSAGTWSNRRLDADALLVLLSIAMVAAAWRMWVRGRAPRAGAAPRTEHDVSDIRPWPWLLGIGVVLGIVTGLLGIGGGFLIVPLLTLVARVPTRLAVGSSLALVATSALLAFASHAIAGLGHIPASGWHAALIVVAAGMAGAVAGSVLSHRMTTTALERAFAIVLVPVAAMIAYDGLRGLVG